MHTCASAWIHARHHLRAVLGGNRPRRNPGGFRASALPRNTWLHPTSVMRPVNACTYAKPVSRGSIQLHRTRRLCQTTVAPARARPPFLHPRRVSVSAPRRGRRSASEWETTAMRRPSGETHAKSEMSERTIELQRGARFPAASPSSFLSYESPGVQAGEIRRTFCRSGRTTLRYARVCVCIPVDTLSVCGRVQGDRVTRKRHWGRGLVEPLPPPRRRRLGTNERGGS